MKSIGENLKNCRKRAGLTQREVELELGLRRLSLRDFETERLKLPVEMAMNFASLYHVTLDELIYGLRPQKDDEMQKLRLNQLESFFAKSEFSIILMDPVIRASVEVYFDRILETSFYEVLCTGLSSREQSAVTTEIMKCIGSMLGSDYSITEAELSFFSRISVSLGLDENIRIITKSLSVKTFPESDVFNQVPGLRHFLIWILFFIAKSDGNIGGAELDYILECSEKLKIHRSHYLLIKKFFVREIH